MRRWWLGAIGVVALAGCAGQEVRRRADRVAELISVARERGAERCAPIELAIAVAHQEFVRIELDEGDYFRASDEVERAEQSAAEAIRRTPAGGCDRTARRDRDGDGIGDDVDECVDRPEDKDSFADQDGCPDPDNDNDGLADLVDSCTDQAEDKDGFGDSDGCPDEDNDQDKFADRVDQCPDTAEDLDGRNDDDGCPDCDDDGDGVPECPEARDKCPNVAGKAPDGCSPYQNIVVTDQRIELKQAVYFLAGRAVIRSVSFAMLGEVAQALRDNPTIRLRIEGHTDSQGKESYNLRLSRTRASAVLQHLIRSGIEPSRLESEGYGEMKPIADNRTAEGRGQNRRVEFVITSR